MKKLILFTLAAATMLLAGSCQKEVEYLEGGTFVRFDVSAGDVATKAIADASNITVLHWELYGSDIKTATSPYGEGKVVDQDGDKNFTVELRLVADQDYNIVFWAETEHGATHYDTQDLRMVKINTYADENANDESRAAFFGVHNFHTQNGVNVNEKVTLYRPFSQINLGTTTYVTDLNQINGGQLQVSSTQMTVTKIANVFNTLDGVGEIENFNGEVTFKAAATPNGEADKTQQLLRVNEDTYYWIGMNYLIVEGDSDAVDVDVVLNTNMGVVEHSIANVPVKENYRTNILGDFLTTGATFQIVVDENFQTPEIILGDSWSHMSDFKYLINEGAPAGTLKAVLDEADAEARALATKAEGLVVMIDLAADVDWVTEGSHGSSPLLPADSPISRVVINGNGRTFTATGAGVGSIRLANGGVLEFNNLNVIDKSVSYNEGAWELTYLEFSGMLSFNDCTFSSGIQLQAEEDLYVLASFVDCTFISNEADVYCAWVSDGVAGFQRCTFEGTRGLKIHEAYDSEVAAVLVEDCEFGPMSKKPGIAMGDLNTDTDIYIYSSKFIDCQAGDQGLYMYETDTDVESFTFIHENNTVISSDEPVVQEDGSVVVPSSADLQAIFADGYKSLKLLDGTYSLSKVPAGLSLVGLGENVLVDVQNKVYGVNGAVSFENVTIEFSNANYKGFQHTSQEYYKDCTIIGQPFLYGETVVFEDCTFEQESADAYNVWTYGAKNVTFEGCTFNSAGKSVLVYAEGSSAGSEVTFNDCELNASAPVEGKAAIEIDSSLIKGEYVVRINDTQANGFADGNVSGNSLWNNKKGTKTSVFVDGTQVL